MQYDLNVRFIIRACGYIRQRSNELKYRYRNGERVEAAQMKFLEAMGVCSAPRCSDGDAQQAAAACLPKQILEESGLKP
eukprot:scaffold11835_cov34-Prasinocladus_malaysianus.AAC.2